MSKINEQGEVGYCKAPLWLTARIHIKATILRIKNWDAEKWYRKYGK